MRHLTRLLTSCFPPCCSPRWYCQLQSAPMSRCRPCERPRAKKRSARSTGRSGRFRERQLAGSPDFRAWTIAQPGRSPGSTSSGSLPAGGPPRPAQSCRGQCASGPNKAANGKHLDRGWGPDGGEDKAVPATDRSSGGRGERSCSVCPAHDHVGRLIVAGNCDEHRARNL